MSMRSVAIVITAAAIIFVPGHARAKIATPAEHAQVIVVGAGMAGMTGALLLAQKGVDVVLLEKEDAVGGKLYSPLLGGVAANLGTQYFFPGIHPVVDAYIKSMPTQPLNAGGFIWKGKFEKMKGDLPAPGGMEEDINLAYEQMRIDYKLAGKGKEFFFDAEPRNREWDRLEKIDSREYLSKFPAHVYEFFNGETGIETGGDLRNLSAVVLVGWNGDENQGKFLVKGGNRALLEKMKDDFKKAGGRVYLKAEVIKVFQDGAAVTAICADGRKFTSEYLIMAAPAQVAKKIVTGLSAKKAEALGAVAYSPMTELGLHLKNFTRDSVLVMGESVNGIINQTGPMIGEPDQGTVVSITITNPETLKLGDQALVERAAGVLKKVSPEFDPSKDILAYSIKRWEKGVFKWSAGFGSKYQKALREPVGRIYFAGDYVGDPSLMGAAWAGSTAADKILASIKK